MKWESICAEVFSVSAMTIKCQYVTCFTFMHFSRRFYPKRLTLHSSYSFFFYIWSALAFPGNRTHDLGVASAMLYHLSYRKAKDFYSKNIDLSKSDHVCGSESCHEQRKLLRTSGKELMLLVRLEKVTKPSLKSLDSTNPQSDRLCTNGANSRPLLPSREVVDQQRSLQSRTCNSLWGCKSSQCNF